MPTQVAHSFGIHELFHIITNTNSKLLEKKRLFVLLARKVWMHMLLIQWLFGTFFAEDIHLVLYAHFVPQPEIHKLSKQMALFV